MTDKGLEIIMRWEGLPPKNPLDAYWDKNGKVWTIGYGATHYPDGSPVKKGDKLKSKDEAIELLRKLVKTYEKYVDHYVKSQINPYQRDALSIFTYNLGPKHLEESTLLKKVNANPDDPTIRDAFAAWNKVKNPVTSQYEVSRGLANRRKAEADLYFTEWQEPLPEYNSTDPRGPYYPSQDDDKDNVSWMYQYHSEHE